MDALLYTAVSGAIYNMMQQEVSANNLANVNTQGFKADLVAAKERRIEGNGFDSRHLAVVRDVGANLASGFMDYTGRDLDIALKGMGFIALQGDDQALYSRNGSLQIDEQGKLTAAGYPVMGNGGQIVIPAYKSLSISTDGTISIIPEGEAVKNMIEVDKIKIVDLTDEQVKKNAQGFFVSANPDLPASEGSLVMSGHLERSNVSAITEMVNTLSLTRHFETQIKMMKIADSLADSGNRLLRST